MNKTVLLATAAALALSVGVASAHKASHPAFVGKGSVHQTVFHTPKGSKTLYDQTGNGDSNGVDSQNFESTYAAYDDQGADDFSVPKGTTWTVTEVDAPGLYYNGYGPATSENVIFYKDSKGEPGKSVAEVDEVSGSDSSGSFAISLGKKGVSLKKGHYWVSVVANCSFGGGCGQWGWATSTATGLGDGALWQNPGGGFGICPTWDTLANCIGVSDTAFQFALKGKASKK